LDRILLMTFVSDSKGHNSPRTKQLASKQADWSRVARLYRYFQTKNPILGKFWRVLYIMEEVGKFSIGYIYGQLVNFIAIW
jgi:hypothetical protein